MSNADEPSVPPSGLLPTLGELDLSDERRAILAPKLAALLAQLQHLDELEQPEIEPAPTKPERWEPDGDR